MEKPMNQGKVPEVHNIPSSPRSTEAPAAKNGSDENGYQEDGHPRGTEQQLKPRPVTQGNTNKDKNSKSHFLGRGHKKKRHKIW